MKKIMMLVLAFSLLGCAEEKKEETDITSKKISIKDLRINKEEEKRQEIIKLINEDNIDRIAFKTNVLPLLENLKDIDSVRFNILTMIGNKLSRETNEEAFQLGIENLKNEILKK